MRALVRLLVPPIALGLALVACSGEKEAAPRFQPPAPKKTAGGAPERSRATRAALELPPPAHMFAGRRNAEGVIQTFCRGDRCRTEARAKPGTFLAAPASGFVVFTVHRPPAGARLEVRRTGEDVAAREDLSPGTTMIFPIRLSEGRYRLALVVTWRDGEARWLFGLKVD